MKSSYPTEPVMEPLLVNPYELRHVKQLDRHYGDVPNQIILLMLDNLKKPVSELTSSIERWAYLFKDTSMRSGVTKISETKEIEDPEMIIGQDEALKDFIERVEINHLPFEIRDRYIRAVKYYNDSILDIQEKAESKGEIKGRKEERARVIGLLHQQGRADDIKLLDPDITEDELQECITKKS